MTQGRDFYYEGAGRRGALDELFEAIHRPAAVVCIAGVAGSGRTALVERFCQEADPAVLAVAVVTGDILMSAEQCLFAMADGLQPDEALAPSAAIERVQAGGRTPVLIVDDAHELGEQPRAAVAKFCVERGVPLVLAGDLTLAAEPARTQEAIVLRAFTEEESEDFVAAWLAVGDEDELPSHRTVERLHRQSAGMPGRLAALLASGAATRNTWFPAGFPLWHVVFSVAAVGVLLVLLAWLAPQDAGKIAASPEREMNVPLPAPQEVAGQAPVTRASSVAVPRPVEIAPLPVTEAVPPPVASPELGSAETSIALPPPPAPVASPNVVAGKPVSVRRYTADEDALLKEKASRYTLQLFASFNEQAVRQFESAHAGVEIRVFRTVREELPWHVAVTGSYRNKDEAKAAVAKLPAGLRKLDPWARSFQGIQDELRRRKD